MLPNHCVHYLTLFSLFTLAVKEDSSTEFLQLAVKEDSSIEFLQLAVKEDSSTEFLQRHPSRDQESSLGVPSSSNGIFQRSRLEGNSTAQKKALGKVGVEGNVTEHSSIKSLLGKRSTNEGKKVGIEGKVENSIYFVMESPQKRASEVQEKEEFIRRNQLSSIALPKTLVGIKGELPDNFISSSRAVAPPPGRPKSVGKMFTLSSVIRENGGKLRRTRRALNFPGGTSLQFGVCYFPFVVGTHGLFNFGITLGSNWEVPKHVDKYKNPAGHSQARREKRSLYPKIESLLTRIGLDGEQCVFRALCQLSSRRRNKQSYPSRNRPFGRFVDVLLGVLFHYPPATDVREPYDRYDSATMTHTCENVARLCPWVT